MQRVLITMKNCAPCEQAKRLIFMRGWKVEIVDVEAPDFQERFGHLPIMGVPVFMAFRDGERIPDFVHVGGQAVDYIRHARL